MVWLLLWYILASSYAQDFRTNVEGPILLDTTSFAYYCNLLDSLNRPTLYDVDFLFDSVVDSSIPTIKNVKSNDRVTLDQKYLVDKMNKQLRCRASNSQIGAPVISANYINIGIQTTFIKTPRDTPSTCESCVSEKEKDPLDVRFTATVPFRCPDTNLYTKCLIAANLTTTDNIVVKKIGSDSPCAIYFTQTDSDNLYRSYVSIYAVKDSFVSSTPRPNYVLLNFPTFPNVTMSGVTYKDNWNNYQLQTDIRHFDNPRGWCTISGVSQIQTFDGYSYRNNAVGQFSYVRSKSGTPFEVQLRHWPCTLDSEESCACGVAVQEASVDVVVDMCTDGVAHFINHRCLIFPTDSGVKVITNAQKNRFAIIFPSGNSVYGSIVGRQLSLDIYVNSDMTGLQEGMCGTFDQDQTNDVLQAANVEQWRLPMKASIFDGVLKPVPTDTSVLTSYSGETFCKCNHGVATCAPNMNNLDAINRFNWGMTTNVQPRVPGDFGSCTFRMDAAYYSGRYMYYAWKTFNPSLSWPTANGVSEAMAEEYCRRVLWNSSPLSRVCTALTMLELDGVIARCKTEIQIYGFFESAFNIEPELGRLCMSKGAATILGQGMTGIGNLQNLSLAYCDSFVCNLNGNCTNGSCDCSPGISINSQSDCAFYSSAKVGLSSIYKGSLCDIRTEDCSKFLLYTENVDAVFPWCRFQPTKVFYGGTNLGTKTVAGNTVDENSTICYVPKDFLDVITYPTDVRVSSTFRSGPTLFNVSVGNELASQSGSQQLLIYDSYCYNCTPSFDCVLKQRDESTCFINGYCIRNNTIKTGDPTLYCNSALSSSSWSAVPVVPIVSTTTSGARTDMTTLLVTSARMPAAITTIMIETSGALTSTTTTSTTTTTTSLPTSTSFEEAILDRYLRRISKLPNSNISESNVPQLAKEIITNTLPKIPGCVNFPTNPNSDIYPDPTKTLTENMNYFLQTHCTNTSPEDAQLLADALTHLNSAITTMGPSTSAITLTFPSGPRDKIESDLKTFVTNFLQNPPYSLTSDQINNANKNLDLILAQNPNCINANTKANLINPPAWDTSLSVQKNLLNFLVVYCDGGSSTSVASLIETSNNMAAFIQNTSQTTTISTTTTYKTLDGATIAAIVSGVIGSIALLSLMLMCCCCWPNIYACCQIFCGCWSCFTYPQAPACLPPVSTCTPVPVCTPVCTPASTCVPKPVCSSVPDYSSGWRPVRTSVYVRSSPGCADPCSKPISRTLVPYKDRYCGSVTVGSGCHGTTAPFESSTQCKRCL